MGKDAASPPAAPKNENIARILARASATKDAKYPPWASSQSGGVYNMTIAGRFVNERERLGPDFTEPERQWRIKWHKDQALHPSEPRHVPELERSYTNPLRRFYKAPMNYVERNILVPYMGNFYGPLTRLIVCKGAMIYVGALVFWYSLKYNPNTWERVSGWRIHYSRPVVLPTDPAYPLKNPRPNAEDFYENGFKARKVFLE